MKLKNIMLVAATALATLGSPAIAGSYTDPVVEYSVHSAEPVTRFSNAELSFNVTRNGLESIDGTYRLYSYTLGSVDNSINARLGYNRVTDSAYIGAEHISSVNLTSSAMLYGGVAADYSAPVNSFRNGEVFVSPFVGTEISLSGSTYLFGEVSYSWIATQDWARAGGLAEVGLDFAVNSNISIRPSVSRTFNTAQNETLFGIAAVARF